MFTHRGQIVAGLILVSAVLATTSVAKEKSSTAQTYTIDQVHSTVLFRIKHLGISYAYGRFNDLSGNFAWDESDPTAGHFNVEVKAKSIDTDNAKRDKHLRSPDFFDTEKHPLISFSSQSIEPKDKDLYELTGTLSFHGTEKTVTASLEHVGAGTGPKGEHRRGFEAVLTIKRSDFGMDYMLQALGDEVTIKVSLEGIEKKSSEATQNADE